jgi:CheY-like chemotaxis protein
VNKETNIVSNGPLAGPLHILFVDDSADNQILMNLYFRDTSFDVDYATSGPEAIAMFSQKKYDLILMDVEMPMMDGYTATRKIRALSKERLEKLIILAYTANTGTTAIQESLAAGCDGHLSKPLRKQELMATIGHLFEAEKYHDPK